MNPYEHACSAHGRSHGGMRVSMLEHTVSRPLFDRHRYLKTHDGSQNVCVHSPTPTHTNNPVTNTQ